MTSTAGNRQKFIKGLINFMENYGFDGVDLDWEYPQADDRGGITADKANYVTLAKELKAAFGTLPSDSTSIRCRIPMFSCHDLRLSRLLTPALF